MPARVAYTGSGSDYTVCRSPHVGRLNHSNGRENFRKCSHLGSVLYIAHLQAFSKRQDSVRYRPFESNPALRTAYKSGGSLRSRANPRRQPRVTGMASTVASRWLPACRNMLDRRYHQFVAPSLLASRLDLGAYWLPATCGKRCVTKRASSGGVTLAKAQHKVKTSSGNIIPEMIWGRNHRCRSLEGQAAGNGPCAEERRLPLIELQQ